MTEKESRNLTKYFGAGVRAHIWCYHGNGNWCVTISRDGSVTFSRLDPLNRAVYDLLIALRSGGPLEFWPEKIEAHTERISFASAKDAAECVAEIQKAITHVQAVSTEKAWKDIPTDLFSAFADQAMDTIDD